MSLDTHQTPEKPSEIKRSRIPPNPEKKYDPSHLFPHNRGLDFIETTSFHRGSSRPGVGYRLALWSFVASLIDALIVFSMSCFFLIVFSFLVGSEMSAVLYFVQGTFLQFSIGVFLLTSVIYMILFRSLLGFSLGEWACGLRLGTPKDRLLKNYSLRVCGRMLLILGTGVIVLPSLSLIFGRDLAGRISGLPLMSLQESK